MIRILFIVPYPQLEKTVKYVIGHHPARDRVQVDIKVLSVEDTPDFAIDQYDVIIARGYMAEQTSAQYPSLPTIHLSISGFDIIKAMAECCRTWHPRKVAILGFDQQIYDVKDICHLFDTDVEVFAPAPHKELGKTLETALAHGCDALIGGYSANILAGQYHMASTVVQTGRDTVLQTLNEAIHTVDQIRQERVVSQMHRTIIHSSKDGILYVDAGGIIRVCNQAAGKMAGNAVLMNQPLKKAMPYLYKLFGSVIRSGQEMPGHILTIPGARLTVSTNCTPVVANQEIAGVIFNLSDITAIQNLESQIRRKLSERGLKARYTFDDIIYQSSVIARTIGTARRYASSDSNVIIVGETGTGKELFAQSIHNESQRKNGPFVAINCAALPENLLESELFGYVEGAFTGSTKGGKMGLFEQAHGGTLFLDEIGEISLAIQSKLLRVLQERQVRRIGDNKVINVNVRVISATNRSLSHQAASGQFRRDLLYRLDVLRLFLPPLRDRENDVELLFMHLLESLCKESGKTLPRLEEGALHLLHKYPFPGNIRELRNIVERCVVSEENHRIGYEHLQNALYPQDLEDAALPPAVSLAHRLEEGEEQQIRQALAQSRGNKTRAAALLGIDRSTLWRKMQKYNIIWH